MSSLIQLRVHVAQGGGCLQSLLGGSEGLQCSGSRRPVKAESACAYVSKTDLVAVLWREESTEHSSSAM